MKIFAITLFITIYEILLIDYSANNFSLARNWFRVIDSMPVFQSNVEFAIYIGQIPLVIFFGILWSRKRQKEEDELLKKYNKKTNDENR